jgi:hypothetical protein
MIRKRRVVALSLITSLTVFSIIRVLRKRDGRGRLPPADSSGLTEEKSPTPDFGTLTERIELAFRDVYLTLISIIQGVTFGFLATSAFGGSTPNRNQWIAYAICFIAIIIVWQEYMVGATAFTWTPTVLDSIVPFGIGILEFLLIASVRQGVGAFLAAFAAYFGAGVVAYGNWLFHARRGVDLNTKISYPRLGRYVRFGVIACVANFFASIGLISARHIFAEINDVVYLIMALSLMLPLFVHSVFNWNIPLRKIYLAKR